MPAVTMPDGVLVDMPDDLTPEMGKRLRAMLTGTPPPPKYERSLLGPLGGLVGAGETALSAITGLGASTVGGLFGLGSMAMGSDANRAANVIRKIQEAGTYQPKTQAGQIGVQVAAAPFEKASEGWGMIGEAVGGDAGKAIGETVVPITATLAGYRPAVSGATKLADIVGKKAESGAVNLQLSALKPTVAEYRSGDALFAAEEMLKRGIAPSAKGIANLEAKIDALNTEISNRIGSSTDLIKKQEVLNKLTSVRDKFILEVNPEASLSAVQRVGEGFQEHPLLPGAEIPVPLAQKMKQATYRSLREKYGELGTAETEAQKALARGLKEGIAEAVPGIAELNAEESALLRTLSVAERRAFAELNKDPVSMAGAMRSPEMWAAVTMNKSSAFKSLMARQLYKLGKALRSPAPEAAALPPAAPPAPTLSLAPLGESLVPPRPVGPAPQSRGLLSLAEETTPAAQINVPGLDYPLAPRLRPMYERGGIPQQPQGMLNLEPRTEMPVVNFGIPKEPPVGRGMLSLADEPQRVAPSKPIEGVNFPLRQEVLQQPEIAAATKNFVAEAVRLRGLVESSQGFWKNKYLEQLSALEKEFGAGMRQLGVDNAIDALGLKPLYQTGAETKLPIQKTFTLKD